MLLRTGLPLVHVVGTSLVADLPQPSLASFPVPATMRGLEVRIGDLLGPASDVKTGPGRNAYDASEALTPNERHDFRQMAAHPGQFVGDLGVGAGTSSNFF